MEQNQIKCTLAVESFTEDSRLNGTNFTVFLSKENFWKLIKEPVTKELNAFFEVNGIKPIEIK